MAQLQMQQMQVDNLTKTSYAESQKALAAERMNKVQLDAALSAERIQRAEEDRTGGVLNLIKAVKEIQGMNIDQLERGANMVMQLELHEKELSQPMAQKSEPAAKNV